MESTDFIDRLKELAANEDVIAVSQEVNELRSKFSDYVLEEERKAQVAKLEAQEKGEEVPETETDFGKEAFYEIYDAYKAARKAAVDELKAIEERNLQQKRGLIAKLKDVVQNEENIGAAFAAFKEVQEEWKTIGDIPRDKRNDIQTEYSKLIEDFFYNIKIYKELKDHDFNRNHQLKMELIEKLKQLVEVKSIKEVETQLKALQNDWEDIGPVPNEKWEELKDLYWTEVRSVYDRINRFYDDRRSEQQENLKKKQAIIDALTPELEGIESLDSVKEWDDKTSLVLDYQKQWKGIGFGPKKENDKIWKEFRALCDRFFEAKKGFFKEANAAFDAVAEKKQKLIEKVESIKDSTDWKETSNQIIQLQKEWKKLGHAGRRNEQKLWKSFRAACDHFFSARQAHFDEKDKQFEVNQKAKEALLETIESYKLPDSKEEALNQLKTFSKDFNEIGHVPMKVKDAIYNRFKKIMDTHYGALKMEGAEKDRVLFQAEIETISSAPNASRKFQQLRNDIRQQIDREKKEINLLENNLGFFSSNSKGADALRKDVEKKIDRANQKIDGLKRKLKAIPNE
ncbi:MAG: DUF349 domain-containing protein [bacterium]|nr:DUF349 domain-containing protein [bacterium]